MEVDHNAEVLYDRCMRDPVGSMFYQQDLMSFNIASDVMDLQTLCEQLVQAQRFRIFTDGGQICWKTRRRVDADKLVRLATDDRMVYNHIETAGTDGMWSKSLRAKTNLHQTVVNKCLKTLEAQGLAREIKSAKYPARKIYMLGYLTPSEETTGGVFFTDGEMDMALIEALSEVILRFVQDKSWAEQYNSIETPMSAMSTASKKRSHLDMEHSGGSRGTNGVNGASEQKKEGRVGIFLPPRHRVTNEVLVPKYPGSTYPTTGDIHRAIVDSQILNEGLDLNETHIQQLLDSLVYDGRLEKMKLPTKITNGRLSTHGSRQRSPNGLGGMDDFGAIGKTASAVQPGENAPTQLTKRYTHGYRTVRPILYKPPPPAGSGKRDPSAAPVVVPTYYLPALINGLSSAPCCRCPVFNLCETGGPVSPENCDYFGRWLGLEQEWVPGVEDHAAAAAAERAGVGHRADEEDEDEDSQPITVEASQPHEGVCTVAEGFAVPLGGDGRRRTWYHG